MFQGSDLKIVMKRVFSVVQWFRAALAVLPLLFTGCMKGGDMSNPYNYSDYIFADSDESLAVGTVRVREERWYVQLDEKTAGYVANQPKVRDIADGTRACLQFRYVVGYMPDFCTDAILVEWISPIEVGEIGGTVISSSQGSSVPGRLPGDPVFIVTDWITSLEDGFLTLHYAVLSKGKVRHSFRLYPMDRPGEFYLFHDAHGDTEGEPLEGIVCFPVADILPAPDGEKVRIAMTYYDIDKNTEKTLTFECRNPE